MNVNDKIYVVFKCETLSQSYSNREIKDFICAYAELEKAERLVERLSYIETSDDITYEVEEFTVE